VEVDDLPIAVRKWLRRRAEGGPFSGWTWNGESWRSLTEGFERTMLAQALAANGGNGAATARALGTTARVVAYKARKYGLAMNFRKKTEEKNRIEKKKKEGK
jgi:DNA-binding NtrC family response regulator